MVATLDPHSRLDRASTAGGIESLYKGKTSRLNFLETSRCLVLLCTTFCLYLSAVIRFHIAFCAFLLERNCTTFSNSKFSGCFGSELYREFVRDGAVLATAISINLNKLP